MFHRRPGRIIFPEAWEAILTVKTGFLGFLVALSAAIAQRPEKPILKPCLSIWSNAIPLSRTRDRSAYSYGAEGEDPTQKLSPA